MGNKKFEKFAASVLCTTDVIQRKCMYVDMWIFWSGLFWNRKTLFYGTGWNKGHSNLSCNPFSLLVSLCHVFFSDCSCFFHLELALQIIIKKSHLDAGLSSSSFLWRAYLLHTWVSCLLCQPQGLLSPAVLTPSSKDKIDSLSDPICRGFKKGSFAPGKGNSLAAWNR